MIRQIALPLRFEEGGVGDEFYVSDANRSAAELAQRWEQWPEGALILLGPVGGGKSQLARLVAAAAGTRVDLVEDADRPGRDETAIFHALNRAQETGPHVLLTARIPPGAWKIGLPDLRSRLLALPFARIGEPDEPLIAELLAQKLRARGLDVAPDIIEFLTPRVPRSYAALAAVADRLDAAALERQRRLTVPLARDVLADFETGKA
ncbi:HdaA/DnaA family protein [Pacificimonas flava]|uniref:DnaA regulatory inactivator Hda n=1 Tax=Pacificimonas flava TaxID=1234595 RepID=M2TCY7_9SPHN|nr:DnaA/Hda family protein [Pacificimonas flava]EMD84374.1 DnaA regulatory inactivator Hda [Pacificimonas flava]MBB5279751.1 chromosomal replication initiation ATPase DnaA [Pacificimonas flava]